MEIGTIRGIINDVVSEFQRNPFNFLSELDLQSRLASLLWNAAESAGEYAAMEGKHYEPRSLYGETTAVRTNIVKTNYLYGMQEIQHFDIALIDAQHPVQYIKTPSTSNDVFWTQEAFAGIEVKYAQLEHLRFVERDNMRTLSQSYYSKYRDDLRKLKEYAAVRRKNKPFHGVALIFCQAGISKMLINGFEDATGFDQSGVYAGVVSPTEHYYLRAV